MPIVTKTGKRILVTVKNESGVIRGFYWNRFTRQLTEEEQPGCTYNETFLDIRYFMIQAITHVNPNMDIVHVSVVPE